MQSTHGSRSWFCLCSITNELIVILFILWSGRSIWKSHQPIVSDELHIVSLVTLLDAVHTDGIAVCCVTGVTPMWTQSWLTIEEKCTTTGYIYSSRRLQLQTTFTCKNRALDSWCNLKSCTGTDLCSQPFQWHLDCSIFYYLRKR